MENVGGAAKGSRERDPSARWAVVFASQPRGMSPPLRMSTSPPGRLPPTLRDRTAFHLSLFADAKRGEETGANWADASLCAAEPGLHGTDPVPEVLKQGRTGHGLRLGTALNLGGPEECLGE